MYHRALKTDLSSRRGNNRADLQSRGGPIGRRFWHHAWIVDSNQREQRCAPLLSGAFRECGGGRPRCDRGTAISTSIGRREAPNMPLPANRVLRGIGIGLSLIVNALVLRAAFRPLSALNRTAAAVQYG